jgi:hypothetical protein
MDANVLAQLESLGPAGVRREIAKGDGNMGRAGSPIREDIEAWLEAKKLEAFARAEERSEQILISTKAQASAAALAAAAAFEQARWAKWAAIIATIAALIATYAASK